MRWLCLLLVLRATAQTSGATPASPAAPAPPAPAPPAATPPAQLSSLEKQRAAALLQRQTVQRQLDTAGRYRVLPPLIAEASAAADPECPALPEADILPIFERVAKAQDVPAKLLRAIANKESGFRPCAVSSRGAKGLMQLMPATLDQFTVADPFDPGQSVDAGARYLKQLMVRFGGNLPQVLGAYNAGPNAIGIDGKLPDYPETREYVDAILGMLKDNLAQPTPPAATQPQPRASPATRPDPRPGQ